MGSTDRCSVAPGRSASAGMDTRTCCPADAACRGRCAGGEVDPARDGRLEIPRDHPLGSVEARNFDVGDGGATRTTRRFRIRPHCRHKHCVRPDPRRRSSLGRRRARTRHQRHQHATLARVSQHRRRAHVERTTGGLGRRRRHRSSLGQRSRSVRTPPHFRPYPGRQRCGRPSCPTGSVELPAVRRHHPIRTRPSLASSVRAATRQRGPRGIGDDPCKCRAGPGRDRRGSQCPGPTQCRGPSQCRLCSKSVVDARDRAPSVSNHNEALASANILQLPIPGTCFGQRTPQSDMMVWCPRSHARVLPVLPNSRASPWGWPVAPPWASDASSPAATKARSTRS